VRAVALVRPGLRPRPAGPRRPPGSGRRRRPHGHLSTDDIISDNAACTLREAILVAHGVLVRDECGTAEAGGDEIRFAIAPQDAGVKTIAVGFLGPLPPITAPVFIDGWSRRGLLGYTGPPLIELNGAGAGLGARGLAFDLTAAGSTVRGLVINRFSGSGILISGADDVSVQGNHID
jgi:CSLREA domain-containing protein